ncbi:MAG: 5'/3'-nucleotidase SurE [Acidimicrobiia bacterium]|jgi:5'-nucleotidase
MRVLVTNDDGVEAPGLLALTEAIAAAGHDVIVVAPSGERSGSGAAIGRLHRAGPIACTEVEWPSLPGIPVFALDAPPAATVYAGFLGTFGPPPDAVASGVNPGLNSGHLVLHSGTVGAALTAAALGIPGVAVSIAWQEDPIWATAAALVPAALEWAARGDGPARVVNLNVPDVDLADLRGVREARLAPYMEEWTAAHQPGEVHLEYVGRGGEPPAGSDLALVLDGYAAVTTLVGVEPADPAGAAAAIESGTRDYAARS